MSTDCNNLVEAFDAGMAEERARIARVMALPSAQGREGAALALALNGTVAIGLIDEILRMAPAAPSPTYKTRCLLPRHLRLAYPPSELAKGSKA